MIVKVLQIVLRMTKDNKADFEQFVKDYAKYMDDATDAIDPCYIEFPTAEEVTFDEFYTEFAKIGNIDAKTMTAEEFEEKIVAAYNITRASDTVITFTDYVFEGENALSMRKGTDGKFRPKNAMTTC